MMMIAWLLIERQRRFEAEGIARERLLELTFMNRKYSANEMSASIAHEINQPLAAVVASANAAKRWLNRKIPNLEEAKSALDRIANDGHRASSVIGAIRSIYQKQPAQRAPHDLSRIVADILQLLTTELRRHEIVVSFKNKRQQLFVNADKIQLQQVIMNIVMNAIEAMVQNSNGEHRLLISFVTGLQDGVSMTIADNGPGFDPEGSEKIFEPLFTTKSKGMGMGLAICRSIIEAHGGKLTARSPTRGGAIFEIWLPELNHL